MLTETSLLNKERFYRELTSILISILFLLIGICSLLVLKELFKIEGDTVYISIFLLPIIVYLIVSGKVSEFKAPGGLEAKFSTISKQSIGPGLEVIETVETQIISKGDALQQEIENKIDRLDVTKPIILTLTLGKQGYYVTNAILQYVNMLLKYKTFKFIVILDSNQKFYAYIIPEKFLHLMKNINLGNMIVNYLNEGNMTELKHFSEINTKSITNKTTNIEALKTMTEQNINSLIVIDEHNNVKGIVEREQIINKFLISLA